MGRKTASVNLTGAKIGWNGSNKGRTIEVAFWNGNDKIGTMRISEAALWWRPANGRKWTRRPVSHLEKMFG